MSDPYIVQPEDLVGELEGFPIEVVQRMMERAEEFRPDNKSNMSILQAGPDGGFVFDDTPEGHDFWWEVIMNQNFNLFFKRYG